LDEGVVEPAPSHTGFNSPLLVVSKKDLDGVYSFKKPRVVADVRNLNSILEVTDTQSFPLISEIHARLGGATVHSIIDIRSCFNSFLVAPEDRHKLAFTCPYTNRQLCFTKCPFGLSFVGNLVQRVLQELFHDLSFVQIYVDDLTVSTSGSLSYHTNCVAEVVSRLTKANLVVSPEKIVLAQRNIHLLGWSVINGALLPDPRKVNTAMSFPIPTTTRALNSFLGYLNFFRGSISLYSHISACLDKLRNVKNLQDHWTDIHTIAVRKLQQALSSAPLIHAIDYQYPLHVATDASNTGISGVLYMKVDNEVRYVAMASRTLSGSEIHFSTTRKEILAIVYCFKRFSKWLVNKHFTLHTDHRSLIYLHSQEVPNHLLLTYYEVLFGFSYSVVHLPGHLNSIADAGSRLQWDDFQNLQGGKIVNESTSSFILKKRNKNTGNTIEQSRNIVKRTFKRKNKKFTPQLKVSSTFYKKAIKQYSRENAPPITHLPRNYTTGSNNEPINKVTRENKITSEKDQLITAALRYADFITPPRTERDDIINKAHLHGHFGIKAVETTIHRDYNMHWTNMRDDIQRIISTCDACSHYNIAKVGYHPFRSVLPEQPLDHWSLDLGTFNTTSAAGNNYMLVMVDHFSRFTILRALPDKNSLTIAKELLNIFCLFSFPKVISHDNGGEFIGNIVSQLILLSGIDRRLSLPYTPQGNSVCERFVGIAKASIIKMLNGKHDAWDLYLNSVQLAMNVKYSALHKTRPYTIIFNRQPNGFEDYSQVKHTLSTEKADIKLIDDRLAFAQQVVIPEITKLIKATQDNDHARFEKTHRIIRDMYPIGSTVMIQNVHRSSKLDERYSGPFKISGYTKNKSYILTDQQGNLLSRDVPTQQIKLIHANKASQNVIKEGHYEVQAIISHRGTPGNYKYLVHWLGYNDPKEHTWQTEQDFDSKLHIKLYWDRRNAGNINNQTLPKSVNHTIRKRGTRDKHSNKNSNIIRRSQRNSDISN
jgi:putative transposase